MILCVLPYMKGSESVNNLANALNCKKIKLENSKLKDNPNRIVINWGNSQFDISPYPNTTFLNPPEVIAKIINKRNFFQLIEEYNSNVDDDEKVSIPEYTTDKEIAKDWLREKFDIVVRQRLTAHSGEGIELLLAPNENEDIPEVPEAPLYTKYIKKQDEYRVHIIKGVITDIQRKARNLNLSGSVTNYQIRNYSNGFIFVRNNLSVPDEVINQCHKAFIASGLDFGAIDVIWNNHRKAAYILEINTACALKSRISLSRYADAFKRISNMEIPEDWTNHREQRDYQLNQITLGTIPNIQETPINSLIGYSNSRINEEIVRIRGQLNQNDSTESLSQRLIRESISELRETITESHEDTNNTWINTRSEDNEQEEPRQESPAPEENTATIPNIPTTEENHVTNPNRTRTHGSRRPNTARPRSPYGTNSIRRQR